MTCRLIAVSILSFVSIMLPKIAYAQHSVARQWNEILLEAIRSDFARPTVHARNLYHASIAMYDGWAVYDYVAEPYFLGKTVGGYYCPFDGITTPADIEKAREETISYAVFRLLRHRFKQSPGADQSFARFDSLMRALGFDPSFSSTSYSSRGAAALGNYIADRLIEFGLQDGSNEQNNYANRSYEPVNPPLLPEVPGNPDIVDPNRWQPLSLEVFVDQSGNTMPGQVPEFLSAEWGQVVGFALGNIDLDIYEREGSNYWVYHDPGPPPLLDTTKTRKISEAYKWSFALVAVWSGHLASNDDKLWDISPGSIGNIQSLPETVQEYPYFYKLLEGGDMGRGHARNPYTGEPYEPQMVPRGDYARVLAEFWADGPESETPPGHWFSILNYVNDHPLLEKRFKGTGPVLGELEWDVKAYFSLGGAVHDAAIAAWGIKGWYDYVRPVSAIRYMAELGQGSDPGQPRYHPGGIPLIENYIELVEEGDPLAGSSNQNVGKIKLYAWRGPQYIDQPETIAAGVGWILAENWWPYQRPTFVTPPFAGYISGHSTFSRAAAEVLTLITGDEYFPGGMGEFYAPKNEFLVFEEGPSVDVTLQWATYRDASDQTSLSRIWGGIHPPADDIPGRRIGIKVGVAAFQKAEQYFQGEATTGEGEPQTFAYPNPQQSGKPLTIAFNGPAFNVSLELFNVLGQRVRSKREETLADRITLSTDALASGFYILKVTGANWQSIHKMTIIK